MELGEGKVTGGVIASTHTDVMIKSEKAQKAVLENNFVISDTSSPMSVRWDVSSVDGSVSLELNPDKRDTLSQQKTLITLIMQLPSMPPCIPAPLL